MDRDRPALHWGCWVVGRGLQSLDRRGSDWVGGGSGACCRWIGVGRGWIGALWLRYWALLAGGSESGVGGSGPLEAGSGLASTALGLLSDGSAPAVAASEWIGLVGRWIGGLRSLDQGRSGVDRSSLAADRALLAGGPSRWVVELNLL